MNQSKKNVFVMMSGGVDSSVAALLLRDAGYSVTGVFMKNWSPNSLQSLTDCPWQQDLDDAQAVAQQLGIPFRSVNFEQAYHDSVVEYFLAEYKAGHTPNPDIMCNEKIKFGVFAKWAIAEGADYIASGHYARIKQLGEHKLVARGLDHNKDQSYFLGRVSADILRQTLFPLGELTKSAVRAVAAKNKLLVATKKDSQGICFVGHINVGEFLRSELGVKKGQVLSPNGQVVGQHDGAHLYTIGQRHGFVINQPKKLADELHYDDAHRPGIYVLAKDVDKNTITVGDSKINGLKVTEFKVTDVRFYASIFKALKVQIRYQGAAVGCELICKKGIYTVRTKSPLTALAVGQLAVFYQRDIVVGSSIIAA